MICSSTNWARIVSNQRCRSSGGTNDGSRRVEESVSSSGVAGGKGIGTVIMVLLLS